MISGVTGEEMPCDIYIGVVYYQRLRHMVSDKFQVSTHTSSFSVLHMGCHLWATRDTCVCGNTTWCSCCSAENSISTC